MIYILCPYGFKTGGTELLHQLAFALNSINCEAMVVYDVAQSPAHVTKGFEEYEVKFCGLDEVPNEMNGTLIIPETMIGDQVVLSNFSGMKVVYWWLSVDNFMSRNDPNWGFQMGLSKLTGLKRYVRMLMHGKRKSKYLKAIKQSDVQLVQSEYAREFLISLGIPAANIYTLSDYINDKFIVGKAMLTSSKRKKIVIYNPAKGINVTKKIMGLTPNITWVPIVNMTTQEVDSLLHSSMVYIDFGNHPGKDRIPREAAISGNCIITGLRGSAGNAYDVRIPSKYKFGEDVGSISKAASTLTYLIDHYDEVIDDFAEYRQIIQSEKAKFFSDVKNLPNIIS